MTPQPLHRPGTSEEAAEAVIETPVCHMAMVKDSEGNVFLLHRHK